MVAVDVKVDIFHEGFKSIIVCRLKFLPDGIFLHLDVIVQIRTVGEHVTENADGVRHIIFENKSMIKSKFPRCVSVQLSTTVFYFSFKRVSGSNRASLEVQML